MSSGNSGIVAWQYMELSSLTVCLGLFGDVTKCATLEFKATLDKFLSTLPDEPLVTGYTQLRSADSNRLISLVYKKVPRTIF